MIKTLLTLISIFNFCDWVIALFIAGSVGRVESPKDGKRSVLAVGLALFFFGFAIIRLGEFVNVVVFRENIMEVVKMIPEQYSIQATLLSGFKTLTLLFCWFSVSLEKRQRRGLLSANLTRSFLLKVFERLR